jgi:hypothetical protein
VQWMLHQTREIQQVQNLLSRSHWEVEKLSPADCVPCTTYRFTVKDIGRSKPSAHMAGRTAMHGMGDAITLYMQKLTRRSLILR